MVTNADSAEKLVSRSGTAILFQQAAGLCVAPETAVAKDAPVTDVLLGLVRNLVAGMTQVGNGLAFDELPRLINGAESLTTLDLLAVALWCRGTLVAFLGPDEIREQVSGGSFGLRPRD